MYLPKRLHTKQEFSTAMLAVLEPLKPLYSEGCARLHLGETGTIYRQQVIELEAFSRPLWGLVPFWAGGDTEKDFENIYSKGLWNGTNPAHKEYWGGFVEYDQRFVEMAAIACGILMAPEKVWEPLGADGKQNLAKWLAGVNGYQIPDCNWQFFMILVNVALKKKGMPYSQARMEEGLARVESYYLEDGWYKDGPSGQKDYYNPFALHYYGLLYSVFMAQEDPERARQYKARACDFAKDFIYWFDETGEAVPAGRSLTYRFAQASFWAACVYAGIEPVSLPVMKGIIARHLESWMQKPIFDRDGVLTIGYEYPNLHMAEQYNAPGSPYWGMKLFLFLALPDDHPFWEVEASAMPSLEMVRAIPAAGMLAQRQKGRSFIYMPGECALPGLGNWPAKYGKFVYSSLFGFNVALSQTCLFEAAPDSTLAFQLEGSEYVYVRQNSESYRIIEGSLVMEWSPLPGIRVETTLSPNEKGHTRCHRITSEFACTAFDTGFAVAQFDPGFTHSTGNQVAEAHNDKQLCRVKGNGEAIILDCAPNTNLLTPNSVIPAICYHISKGECVINTKVETA